MDEGLSSPPLYSDGHPHRSEVAVLSFGRCAYANLRHASVHPIARAVRNGRSEIDSQREETGGVDADQARVSELCCCRGRTDGEFFILW